MLSKWQSVIFTLESLASGMSDLATIGVGLNYACLHNMALLAWAVCLVSVGQDCKLHRHHIECDSVTEWPRRGCGSVLVAFAWSFTAV